MDSQTAVLPEVVAFHLHFARHHTMSQLPVPVNPDDQGRGPLVMGLTWTFASVAIIAGVLRFYVRTKLAIGLCLDDWLMFAAIVRASTAKHILNY